MSRVKPNHRCLRLLFVLVLASSLGACATAKRVGSADDIQDDGKRNAVMLSYDVEADAFDRYSGENKTTIHLRCAGDGALSGNRACFSLTLPFTGQQLDEGVAVNRFAQAGARPFLMKYGDYRIDQADFKVVIGRTPKVDCYTDKKGQTRCNTTYTDINENHAAQIPVPIDFRVSPGSGCYLGHLTLSMRGDRITAYSLDTEIDPQRFEQLPVELRQRAREFIDRPCG